MRYSKLKFVFFLLLFLPGALFALDFQIKVYDPQAGKPVPDVRVIILETKESFYTDPNGMVQARVPSPGFYTFRTIVPGGELVQPRLQVLSAGQTVTILTREPPPQRQTQQQRVGEGGIQVTGIRERQNISRYNVRLDEIKRIPGQFGEALRGLESLPGVNAPSFGDGSIVLRGANENANTYLLDNLPIGFAFHIFGFNSVIHNDLIKSIDLFTGAYPVNYGNATGGVIYIDTIDNVDKFGGHTTFSLWSANALFKAPIGNGGYWIAAGRVSYLDKTLENFIPSGVTLVPRWYDGQFKAKVQLTETQSIYFYALAARDEFIAKVDNRPTWDPTTEFSSTLVGASINLNRMYHTEAVRHVWVPTSRITNELTALYHNNIFEINASLGILKALIGAQAGYAAIKDEFSWEIMKDHVLFDAGFDVRAYLFRGNGTTTNQINPNNPSPNPYKTDNPDFEVLPVHDSVTAGYDSAYAMMTLRAFGFELRPGARMDYFGPTKQTVLDPRGTISYTLPTNTRISGGAGVYHRTPDPQYYSPSSGNPNLKMERAEHYAIGLEQKFRQWTFKTEGFRHYYTDIIVADPYETTPVKKNQNPYQQYSQPYLYNARLYYSNDGSGFADGFEIYIKRDKDPSALGWYGWVSYTWSRALRNDHQHRITPQETSTIFSADERRILNQYDNTKDRYADFDRTHILNIIFGYKISRQWQVGAKWRYMTSAPFTPIVNDNGGFTASNGRTIFYPVYSDLTNSGRLKPYHRLDIRIDRFFNYEWGYGNVFVELLNVYLRDNPVGQNWADNRPISRTNPETQYDFGTLVVPAGNNRMKIPLLNFGVEVQF